MPTPRLGEGSRAGRHIDALRHALRLALPHLESQRAADSNSALDCAIAAAEAALDWKDPHE